MSAIVDDIVAEAQRLVAAAAAEGITVRLLGGIAIQLRCPTVRGRPALDRTYKDIDVVVPKRASATWRAFLTTQGYVPDAPFNALHGATRLLFYDQEHGRQLDTFLGVFAMCHRLDLEPRLSLPGPALSPSDLLLLKLQIVQLNHKDITDVLALLLQYEPREDDGPEILSARYIAAQCAGDWGWYTTVHDNLERLRLHAEEILPSPDDCARAQAHIDTLVAAIESAPKSMGWRLRDKIGRRKTWYELPEEVEQ